MAEGGCAEGSSERCGGGRRGREGETQLAESNFLFREVTFLLWLGHLYRHMANGALLLRFYLINMGMFEFFCVGETGCLSAMGRVRTEMRCGCLRCVGV